MSFKKRLAKLAEPRSSVNGPRAIIVCAHPDNPRFAYIIGGEPIHRDPTESNDAFAARASCAVLEARHGGPKGTY
jgi:hypothetical protein